MKSYLKFLSRNKLYTAIEAVGLAVSLAFVIIIGSYVWQQYAVTREIPDRERIYVPGIPGYAGLTYGFRDAVSDIPEIELISNVSRMTFRGLRNEDVEGLGVDQSFFDICPQYRFLDGTPDAIAALSGVIVSETFALAHDLKVGDTMTLVESWGDLTVGGILKDNKNSVLLPYDVFFNIERIQDRLPPFDRLGSVKVLIKVAPGTERELLYDKLETVCMEAYPNIYGHDYFEQLELNRVDELFFKNVGEDFKHGDKKTLWVLALVGLLLLLSAVFNYINLSVALTGKRAKEMAVRQISGATITRIVLTNILESIVFTSFCFAAGLLLAKAFCPIMNSLLNNPDVPIQIVWTVEYIFAYIAFVLIIGSLCGAIPAFIAGRYKPIQVMKGDYRRESKMVFSKVFIVMQNVLAVILIAFVITMEAQMHKTQSRPMHCNINNLYCLRFYCPDNMTSFKDYLANEPLIGRVGMSNGIPGRIPSGQYGRTRDGRDILYRHFTMDSTAFSIFNFEKLKDYNASLTGSVWFSDKAFNASGFNDDEHDISFLSEHARGCDVLGGVFKSFPTSSANIGEEENVIISVMRMPDDVMRAAGIYYGGWIIETFGNRQEALAQIDRAYSAFGEGRYLASRQGFWIDDNYAEDLRPARNNIRLTELFMFLSIIISLLGLVAMSTYYADEKSRDIAVRKVFGGTVDTEAWRSIREYMVLVGIACIIGIPIAVYAAQEYLKDYIYQLEGYWWIFVVAVLLTGLIAFVSVIWQVMKAAKTNPAVELKKE